MVARLRSRRAVTRYESALFVHVLGAVGFFAGAVAAAVPLEAARRRADPREIALLLGLTRVGVALVGIGAILLVPTGLWLVELGGWGYSSGWIVAALLLLVLSAALGALGGRAPKRARLLAARLAQEGGEDDGRLRRLLDDRLSLASNYASALIALLILALMVFKPGA